MKTFLNWDKKYVSKTLNYKRRPYHSSCGFKVKLPGAVLFWSWGQLMKWNIWIKLFRLWKNLAFMCTQEACHGHSTKTLSEIWNLELLLFQNGLNSFGLWVSLGRGARAKEEGNCLIVKKFNWGAFGQEARFLQFLVYITRAHLRTTIENVLVLPSFPWTGSNRTPVTLTKYQSWLWQLIRSCQLFNCQSLPSWLD